MFALSRNVVENANEIVKSVARTFVRTVIDETPVDTGKAISNWKVGLDYEPRGESPSTVPGKHGSTASDNRSAAFSRCEARINGRQTGQTIYVANTAQYIDLLNGGRSDQTPAGFVDRARLEAHATLRRARLLRGA
jgi:hypothetical protein